MLSDGVYVYIAAQYWARASIRVALFRMPYDAASEWGTAGEPEAWPVRGRHDEERKARERAADQRRACHALALALADAGRAGLVTTGGAAPARRSRN